MKKLFAITLVALLTAATATYAQGDNNMVRQTSGDMAILFNLNGLANLALGGIGGSDTLGVSGGVGLKSFLSDKMALRVILGFATNSEDSSGFSPERSSTSFSIMPGIQYNLMNSSTVAGYVGGQVGFVSTSSSSGTGDAESTSTRSQLIVGGFLGAEWFPWENVSLGAEYGLMFTSNSGSFEIGSNSTDFPGSTSIELGSHGDITVAFYMN